MKFLFATKEHMTRFFSSTGEVHAATVLSVLPGVVTAVKTESSDGYKAVQIGLGTQKEKRSTKALLGHFSGKAYQSAHEVRGVEGLEKGATLTLEGFSGGDKVIVSGISKGKGFQGVVKRHGFKGGWGQHGQKHSHREPGSIGATWPQRVLKGKKMAGRMGSDVITEKNIEILDVDVAAGKVLVKGAIAGKRGSLVRISA